MKKKIAFFISLAVILIFSLFLMNSHIVNQNSSIDEDVEKLIKVHQLDEKVILVHFGADVEIAFNTTKGIVVVDAGISNSLTTKFREAIEKEFNNNKVVYLINTHSHPDHTGGNQVFSDVPIIGHQNCIEEMSQNTSDSEKSKVNLLKTILNLNSLNQAVMIGMLHSHKKCDINLLMMIGLMEE